ncbi:MAG: AI-2E family transporter [Bacteroidales bacterium]|nr:AI-2E family transporter [Bacteroidales bacterium]
MLKKNRLSPNVRNISLIVGIGVILFLAWYFSHITIYIILALILALLSAPLKNLLSKLRIGKFHLNNTITTVLALAGVIIVLSAIMYLIVPPVVNQINAIVNIDEQQLTGALDQPLQNADALLKHYNVINEDETLKDIMVNTTLKYVEKINVSTLFGGVLLGLASLFLGVFSIFFISFFVLLDFSKVQNTLVRMVPDRYQNEINNTILNSKRLLSNYFVGLFVEIVLMGLLEFIILSLLGIENALLISVIGGVMVVIPYIGSIIACVIGCSIAITSAYISSNDIEIVNILLKVLFTFIGCRLIDNFFLQPFIASKSVRAHPLEIFLIVLISGYIAGVPGMMLGIPAYTFVRVFAKEFFGNNNFIKTLTERMNLPDDYSSSSKS